MIPKKIHYCWFWPNEKPASFQKYLESWKTFLPDYEIILWDEKNFDINQIPYVKEAYNAWKFAFVSDYARLSALYAQWGIYMDTDVEVIRNLDAFLSNGFFSWIEDDNNITTWIIGSESGNEFVRQLMDDYKWRSFLNEDGSLNLKTNVEYTTNLALKYWFKKENIEQEIWIGRAKFYKSEFFCPKSWYTWLTNITDNTYVIHHFNCSWFWKKDKFIRKAMHVSMRLGIHKPLSYIWRKFFLKLK